MMKSMTIFNRFRIKRYITAELRKMEDEGLIASDWKVRWRRDIQDFEVDAEPIKKINLTTEILSTEDILES